MTDSIAEVFADFFANPLVSTVLTLLGIAVVAMWLAAAWWAYQDAARRSESTLTAFLAAAWIVVSTPLLLPVALAIYAFVRPQVTAADHRARDLARALGAVVDGPACPTCRQSIEPTWLRCPACADWLAAPCRSCGVWSGRDLPACPYCGSEEHAAPVVEPDGGLELPKGPIVPVGPGLAGPVLGTDAGTRSGGLVRARAELLRAAGAPAEHAAGHGTTAAGATPAAVGGLRAQRGRVASSARPFSYATSRDASSASS